MLARFTFSWLWALALGALCLHLNEAGASQLLEGFENTAALEPIRVEDARDSITARVASEVKHGGNTALRIDFSLHPGFTQQSFAPFTFPVGRLARDQWGLEFWMRGIWPDGVQPAIWLIEEDGEAWGFGIPRKGAQDPDQWVRVPVVLQLGQLIPWTRVNGRLDRDHVKRVEFVFEPTIKSSQPLHSTVWLDDFSLIDARQQVSATLDGAFVMLNLGDIFNSDGVAFAANPLDGDFNTGEWEQRALPGEAFPKGPLARFHDIPFLLPDVTDGRDNHIRCNGQQFTGFPAQGYSALYVLATGKFGDQVGNVVLNYADGTSQSVMLEVSDWSTGATRGDVGVVRFPFTWSGKRHELRFPEIYLQSLRLDPARQLVSLQLPMRDYLKVFGLTLCSAAQPPQVATLQQRPLEVNYPQYATKALHEIDFNTTVSAAGVFGGYLTQQHGSPVLMTPTYNGGLVFQCETNKFPQHMLSWDGQGPRHDTLDLGALVPDGSRVGDIRMELGDWTLLRHEATIRQDDHDYFFRFCLSRVSPAALYESDARRLIWRMRAAGGPLHVAYAGAQGMQVTQADEHAVLSTLREPWLLVWQEESPTTGAVPMLLVLEKKPSKIALSGSRSSLAFDYSAAAGRVAVMPLQGINRVAVTTLRGWQQTLPDDIIAQCRDWAGRLQAYPLAVRRVTRRVGDRVEYRDKFTCAAFKSDWQTTITETAPLPPIVQLAAAHGFPVQYAAGAPTTTSLDTFWGPYAYVRGDEAVFSLPVPSMLDQQLVPAYLTGDPLGDQVRDELAAWPERMLGTNINSSNCGDASLLRVLSSLSLVTSQTQPKVRDYCRAVVRNQLRDDNLKVEKELMTGNFFLMDDRFWANTAAYDKEWANGLMLQGFWYEGYYQRDFSVVRENWAKIKGLYRYYQLIFDWPTGSTFTMVTGVGGNSDGLRFAWEGMLAMARLAREMGDEATCQDALQRATMQMLHLYTTWQLPAWSAAHDYVMCKSQPVPVQGAELRFAPDSTSEFFGCNVSKPSDLFQTCHAVYIYNLNQLTYLHDYGLDEPRLREWFLDTLPRIHPQWCDGNVWSPGTDRYYGNEQIMSVLIVRALLLHRPMLETFACYEKAMRNTRVRKEWYTPEGNAVFALSAMLTGEAPLVLAPIYDVDVVANRYDAATARQVVELLGRRDAQTQLRIRCWKDAPRRVLLNGAPQAVTYDAKLDYAHVAFAARRGQPLKLEVQY